MLAILVLTLLAQALVVQASGCSVGWHLHNGVCFGFGTDEVTWADALTICQQYDAKLAESRSASVHFWLLSQLRTRGVEEAWIGGTDMFQEGAWVWVSDQTAIGQYNKWRKGQPNDYPPSVWPGIGTPRFDPLTVDRNFMTKALRREPVEPRCPPKNNSQDCMKLLAKYDSGWDDDRCAEVHYFICQKDESGPTVAPVGGSVPN